MAYKARPVAERFWGKVDQTGECWVWTAARYPNGYGIFVAKKGESPEGAHRVAYRLVHGRIPKGMQILHRCDNRACVRPDHLFAGTQGDNIADMHAKKRWKRRKRVDQRGEKNPNAILSDAQVAQMLADLAAGEGPVSVARRFGIHYKTLWAIRRRKR